MLQCLENCFKQVIILIKINCQDEAKKTGYLNVVKIAVWGLCSQSVRARSTLPFRGGCTLEPRDPRRHQGMSYGSSPACSLGCETAQIQADKQCIRGIKCQTK